jgi:hypothetical protein
MIKFINPYQRFTKNQLNQKGYKLAFIDNNFLSFLTELVRNDPKVIKMICEAFKQLQIRPVLNSFVFYEFMKGLDPFANNFNSLCINKRKVAQLLDELGAIWIQDFLNVLAFELLHVYENKKEEARDFYHIYSFCPLGIMTNRKPFTEKGTASYPCDEIMHFCYGPYSDDLKKLVNPVENWHAYFEHSLKNLTDFSIDNILKKWVQDDEKAYKIKEKIKDAKEIIYKKRIQKYIEPLMGDRFAANHERYIFKKAEEIYESVNLDFSKPCLLSYAPLYSISSYFYWDTLEGWDVRKKQDKKLRDIFDRLHIQVALSYCDYFITDDGPITQKANKIINKLGLKSAILKYDENAQTIEDLFLNPR